MAVRNFQCRYKIYTKKEIDDIIDGINTSIEDKQDKLTAGTNIAISDENVISATDTKYTAGTNIAISDENVISATDTKYTAGTGIIISEQNVISASGGGEWTLRTPNNDWSDIFDYDPSSFYVIAKKNIFISYSIHGTLYLPKGYRNADIRIPINTASIGNTSNVLRILKYAVFQKADISSSVTQLYPKSYEVTFTTDGTNVSISTNSGQSGGNGINKNQFTIYTLD